MICKQLQKIKFIEAADMKGITSFRTGGRASMLVLPKNIEELKRTLQILDTCRMEFMVIGNGSNILILDGGYHGIIIKLGEGFETVTVNKEERKIIAGAGALMSRVAREAFEAELTGFEAASGIPGSLGGGLFMNAGAYGWELRDVVVSARVISANGKKEYTMTREEMGLGYRKSIFEKTGDIVVGVTLQLENGEKDQIGATMKELTGRRNEKQPVTFPSAGSFFKRPEGHFAGQLIEEAGLKGLTVGGAQVSTLHAGFIINTGNATTKDIVGLMRLVQNTVYDKTGVMLEPEVRIFGEEARR